MKLFKNSTAVLLVALIICVGISFSAQEEADETMDPMDMFKGGALLAEKEDGESYISVYENTSEQDFIDYCNTLETLGYNLKYNFEPDYGKFAAYEKENDILYFYYTKNDGETRIIRDIVPILPPLEEKYTVKQGEKEYFTPVIMKSEGKTEASISPKITQLNMDYSNENHGMCYIITLSDGSFILVDSGQRYNPQHIHIWNVLNELNERPDGKIIIRAWFLTHGHSDHYASFEDFARTYGSQCELGYFIYNGDSPAMRASSVFDESVKCFAGSPKSIIPHTGQRIVLGDAMVEILTTHEDVFPTPITDDNDTSMVFRVNLAGQSIMFTGDAQFLIADAVISTCGDHLVSDFVQVSHHGYGDIGYDFYKKTGASFGFWPHATEYYIQYSTQRSDEVDRTQFWSEKNMIYTKISHIEAAEPTPVTVVLPFDFAYDKVIYNDVPLP